MGQVRIRISSAIANEWANRGIDEVIPNLPAWAYGGCSLSVTLEVARDILTDCEFNGDSRRGPEEMPAGTRRAYCALAQQIRSFPGFVGEKFSPVSPGACATESACYSGPNRSEKPIETP